MNAGTSPLGFGEGMQRLHGKWASIAAFGALLALLGLAALFFSLVATIATATLNGVPFPIAGAAGDRHRNAFALAEPEGPALYHHRSQS